MDLHLSTPWIHSYKVHFNFVCDMQERAKVC